VYNTLLRRKDKGHSHVWTPPLTIKVTKNRGIHEHNKKLSLRWPIVLCTT